MATPCSLLSGLMFSPSSHSNRLKFWNFILAIWLRNVDSFFFSFFESSLQCSNISFLVSLKMEIRKISNNYWKGKCSYIVFWILGRASVATGTYYYCSKYEIIWDPASLGWNQVNLILMNLSLCFHNWQTNGLCAKVKCLASMSSTIPILQFWEMFLLIFVLYGISFLLQEGFAPDHLNVKANWFWHCNCLIICLLTANSVWDGILIKSYSQICSRFYAFKGSNTINFITSKFLRPNYISSKHEFQFIVYSMSNC